MKIESPDENAPLHDASDASLLNDQLVFLKGGPTDDAAGHIPKFAPKQEPVAASPGLQRVSNNQV